MIVVNINVQATVTLTPFGLQILEREFSNIPGASNYLDVIYPNRRTTGIIRTQLWEIMRVFGSHLDMGVRELPFVGNNIQLEEHL